MRIIYLTMGRKISKRNAVSIAEVGEENL